MMNANSLNDDSQHGSLMQELLGTPVGRRWLLKAGLGSAAAIAAAQLPFWGGGASVATAAGLVAQGNGGSATTTLHFALGSLGRPAAAEASPNANANANGGGNKKQGASAGAIADLTLVGLGAEAPLVAHTAASRTVLKAQGGLYSAMDLEALTHYVEVPMPSDRTAMLSVHGKRGSKQVLVSQMWYTPPATTRALADLASRGGGLKTMVGSPSRLKKLGLTPQQVSSPDHVAQLDLIGDSHQTAAFIVGLHPNVATKDQNDATVTKNLLLGTDSVGTLGDTIDSMQAQGQDYATYVAATNPDGSPTQIQLQDPSTTPPKVINTTFSTVQLNGDNSDFGTALQSGVSDGVKGVRDAGDLGQVVDKPISAYPTGTKFKTWTQPQGVTPQSKPHSLAANAAAIQATIKNTGLLFGTKTEANGDYANGQQKIKIYNNYVRWMWAYVQYLGKDGANLSADPNASWPDTKYAKSLALVPQVPTVFGIPLWDTNIVDVTLNFPPEAHSARLLYCGLGSDINGGGWRQYFPDDAYPGRIAPTDEVLFPALFTGIITIGLTFFALLTDLNIALAWDKIRRITTVSGTAYKGIFDDLNALFQASRILTASETFATTVAGGYATYTDVQSNGGSTANIWGILVTMASAIPKILFSATSSQFWLDVAASLAGAEVAQQVIDAIPILGEALAVLTVVGDVATLAEVSAETITSPWVIGNEISLTYQANVTINRDPNAATFPRSINGLTYQLQAKLDGSVMPESLTGTIPDGESNPLQLNVTAPFGGQKIQWTVTMTDGSGFQLASGTSNQLVNDDPANPPTEVTITITEIPEPITAQTVFERDETLTYSETAGGYTWAKDVTDNGTRVRPGIQAVTGATVATTLGVAGVVWKQNDRYFLRGVPVAENGPIISITTAPKEGYARPPFLLFDPFVGKDDVANHVLLEPDDTSDAYFVRKLTLDAQNGAISWDLTVAHGVFTLPVSAAALHASGRVVAVHTDSGRVGWLHPAATPRPGLAAYSAGPGTQVGLLQSPTALAVTIPGVVLILEAGAGQLAAFDLNGNPIKYFGADPSNLQYTQKLLDAAHRTYLDLAVDGSSQIYLLYYTGNGSQPDDYYVDVSTASGEPIATHSPGVNVAKLAVDYWRNIYGVSFNPLIELGTTTPRIDPALGVPEPALSIFLPVNPPTSRARAGA